MKLLLSFFALLMFAKTFSQSQFLDNSFGHNGKVITNLDSNAGIYAIALQSDQKIIAVGYIGSSLGILRYKPNGSLDSSFGINGIRETNIDTGTYTRSLSGRSIIIQKDQKIVIAGTSYGNPTKAFVARYLPNGLIDSTFGINGITLITIANLDDELFSIALEDDQKILACGQSYIRQSPYLPSLSLFRFDTNGRIDSSFGSNGSAAIDFVQDGFSSGHDVEFQSGKILVTGYAGAAQTDIALARFKESGSLDSSFGINGKVMQDFGANENAYYARIDNRGNIITCGEKTSSSFADGDFLICRFKANGELDSSFGNYGKQITDFYGGNDIAYSLAFQHDSGFVVCGTTNNAEEVTNISTIRYNYNGYIDSTFGNNGFVTFDTSVKSYGASVAIQSDNKILVGGSIGNLPGNTIVLRYLNSEVLSSNFLTLTANKVNSTVQLLWQTVTGNNTLAFNIQRSVDGKNYTTISRENIKYSNTLQHYDYTDTNVEYLQVNHVYYRLQEVNKDGLNSYSNIVSVNLGNIESSFKVSPNPTHNNLFITSTKNILEAQVNLFNMNGKKLYSKEYGFTANQQMSIPLISYAKGIYIVVINYQDKKEQFKVIKE